MKSSVLIQKANYSDIQEKVEAVFERFPMDLSGKKVFVKPNILGPYKPEKSVTTHPSLVRAVVRVLKSAGSEVIVGDNSGPLEYGRNQRAAEIAGIVDAADGCYKNIGATSTTVKIRDFEMLMSSDVIDCDIFISLPKFKTHVATVITGGIKNSFGLLIGKEKAKLHSLFPDPEEFAHTIVDVFNVRRPDLLIMDAVSVMEGDGPNSPHLRDANLLISSDSAVAMDTVMCYMMGVSVDDVKLMHVAKDRNIGPTNLDEIIIDGELAKLKNFRVPVTHRTLRNKAGEFKMHFLNYLIDQGKLSIEPSKCETCLLCVEACPQQTIKVNKNINSGKPFIDDTNCISCFCCKEMCQHEAIQLNGFFSFLQKKLTPKETSPAF